MSRTFGFALVILAGLALPASAADGKRYAVVVGVQKYDDPQFTSTEYAGADATDLAKALTGAGYTVTLLTDAAGQKDPATEPTRKKIQAATDAVLGKCGRDDLVLVAFAGHGLRAPNKGEVYLCPKDAKPLPNGAGTLIPLNDLCKALAESQAGTRLLLLDTPTSLDGEGTVVPDKVSALFSCAPGERSVSHKDIGHGVFFHQILEGLRGKAADGDDAITVASLAKHVRAEVPGQAEKLVKDAKQTPRAYLAEGGPAMALAFHPQAIPPEEWKEYLGVWSNGSTNPFLEKHAPKRLAAWRKAAEAGSARGMMLLADCYEFGAGVAKDGKEAAKWYTRGAERGNSFAMVGLGMCYRTGLGGEKDSKEAVKWFRRSAELGDPGGMDLLGSSYLRGDGVEKDAKEGLRWLRKSADLGFGQAATTLAFAYMAGEGVEKDEKEAVKWLRKGADAGNQMSLHALGMCLLEGRGATKDEKEAVRLFRKAADAGYGPAAVSLGVCYKLGRGVEEDEKESLRWMRKGADLGDRVAMMILARCYLEGLGVDVDEAEGVKWLKKAADLGERSAMTRLGMCYLEGTGVDKDRKEATLWLKKAAALGDPKAKEALKSLRD